MFLYMFVGRCHRNCVWATLRSSPGSRVEQSCDLAVSGAVGVLPACTKRTAADPR